MPLVRPDYKSAGYIKDQLVAGRYTVKIIEAKESDKLDKNGHNALVVKMEVVNNKNHLLNGKRVSRWLPLGGLGAKVLYRFLKSVDNNYKGAEFTTESLLGKLVEVDLTVGINPATNKEWVKVDRIYQYLPANSVADTFLGNVSDEKVPDFDDFDTA